MAESGARPYRLTMYACSPPSLRIASRSALVLAAFVALSVVPVSRVVGQRASPGRAEPLTPFARQKAERLLRDKLGCLGCHRLGADGGMLAPALDSVGTRRSPAYIAAIITDPQRMVPGAAMPRTQMPAADRALIIRYLGGDPAAPPPFVGAAGAPVRGDTSAVALYGRWCAGCHGVTGNGDGPNAAQLPVPATRHADASMIAQRGDDALYDTIHGGGAIMNRSARMPAFGATLSPQEIRALVRYIRTLCRCEGPSWSRGG